MMKRRKNKMLRAYLARLAAERHDERRRGRIEAVAGDDELVARLEGRAEAVPQLLAGDDAVAVGVNVAAVGLLVDAEDRARRDVRVDVRRAVERVEDGDVLLALLDDDLLVDLVEAVGVLRRVLDADGLVLLLRREHGHLAREAKRVLKHRVRDHVELLLLLALDVDVARRLEAEQRRLLDRRGAHELRDGLARALDRGHDRDELDELRLVRVRLRHLEHVAAERDAGVLADLREDGLAKVHLLGGGHRLGDRLHRDARHARRHR